MSVHVLHTPCHVVAQYPDGEPRWCFRCRARVPFTRTIWAPNDPMSYYGAHANIACERGHTDGDLFPGRIREWE